MNIVIKRTKFDIVVTCKYFYLALYRHPFWVWEVRIPKYTNWVRFSLSTPLFQFCINGWLLWGKKPKEWG